jgi:hypothetical protein
MEYNAAMSKKLFKVTEDTTYGELKSFFDSFVVTGVTTNGKRFKYRYIMPGMAFAINLYRGSVWGVKGNKKQLLKRVYN